jgi:GTP1/Obg family GTP-binding protein
MANPDDYPDISDLIARKAKGRVSIIHLSLGKKIEMMEELRDRLAPLRALREARRLLAEGIND